MRRILRSPVFIFSVSAFALTSAMSLLLYSFGITSPYWMYMLSLNVVAFVFYGFDKLKSLSDGFRVPEAVLHLLALAGGFAGGFCGRSVFRHKTQKPIFFFILCIGASVHIVYILSRYLR